MEELNDGNKIEGYNIVVQMVYGNKKSTAMEIPKSFTIYQLKEKIEAEVSCHPSIPTQKVIFAGKLCEDHDKVEDIIGRLKDAYDATHCHVFHLILPSKQRTSAQDEENGGGDLRDTTATSDTRTQNTEDKRREIETRHPPSQEQRRDERFNDNSQPVVNPMLQRINLTELINSSSRLNSLGPQDLLERTRASENHRANDSPLSDENENSENSSEHQSTRLPPSTYRFCVRCEEIYVSQRQGPDPHEHCRQHIPGFLRNVGPPDFTVYLNDPQDAGLPVDVDRSSNDAGLPVGVDRSFDDTGLPVELVRSSGDAGLPVHVDGIVPREVSTSRTPVTTRLISHNNRESFEERRWRYCLNRKPSPKRLVFCDPLESFEESRWRYCLETEMYYGPTDPINRDRLHYLEASAFMLDLPSQIHELLNHHDELYDKLICRFNRLSIDDPTYYVKMMFLQSKMLKLQEAYCLLTYLRSYCYFYDHVLASGCEESESGTTKTKGISALSSFQYESASDHERSFCVRGTIAHGETSRNNVQTTQQLAENRSEQLTDTSGLTLQERWARCRTRFYEMQVLRLRETTRELRQLWQLCDMWLFMKIFGMLMLFGNESNPHRFPYLVTGGVMLWLLMTGMLRFLYNSFWDQLTHTREDLRELRCILSGEPIRPEPAGEGNTESGIRDLVDNSITFGNRMAIRFDSAMGNVLARANMLSDIICMLIGFLFSLYPAWDPETLPHRPPPLTPAEETTAEPNAGPEEAALPPNDARE